MSDLAARVGAFLEAECDLLDARRWRDWLALFEPDGWYWVPASPDAADPREALSHVYEHRPALDARIERLCEPRVLPQRPPSRTSRLIGRVRAAAAAAGTVRAQARFHLVEARMIHDMHDEQRIFAGEAHYLLVPREGGFRIRMKRVDLLNAQAGLRGVSIIL